MKATTLTTLPLFLVTAFGLTCSSSAWAKSTGDKIKDAVEEASHSIQKGIDELGDDFEAIQNYLNDYSWKGLIQDKATSDHVTLKHLELNNNARVVVVKPEERIDATVQLNLHKNEVSMTSLYRIVIGIKDIGPQTTIGNEFGFLAGKSLESFTMYAPAKKGIYEIRFRAVDSLSQDKAMKAWHDEEGNEPDARTTIGLIVVK